MLRHCENHTAPNSQWLNIVIEQLQSYHIQPVECTFTSIYTHAATLIIPIAMLLIKHLNVLLTGPGDSVTASFFFETTAST